MRTSVFLIAAILAALLTGCWGAAQAGPDAANPASFIGLLVVCCLAGGKAAMEWTWSRIVRGF